MAILLDVLSGQIQFLAGLNLLWVFRRLCRLRKLRNSLVFRLVSNQLLSLCFDADTYLVRIFNLNRQGLFKNISRRKFHAFPRQLFPILCHDNCRIRVRLCRINTDIQPILSRFHIDGCVNGRVFHLSDCLVRHEILMKNFLLIGFEPCEVWLIVTVHTGHQLNVGSIFVCKIAIPRLAEIPAAPGPLLLPR